MNIYLFILSALIASTSGNIFSGFPSMSSFQPFSPFSSFPGFGSSFPSFPFGQSFGSSFTNDDPFNSAFSMASSPFTNSFSPSSTPQSSSPFGSGFSSGGFPFQSFPSFPSFPPFNSLTNGLKGNGYKVTSTSSEGKDGNSGQVTIQVEKIGSEKLGPGERRQMVQTFRTSGPAMQPYQIKGQQTKQRPTPGQRPVKTPNQKSPNQQRKPSFGRPVKPTTTPIKPFNEFPINGTTSTQQQSIVSKPIRQESNNSQLINNDKKVSSSATVSSSSSSPTSQTSASENRSSDDSKATSTNQAKSSGITIRRVNSSGRVTTGFIQP